MNYFMTMMTVAVALCACGGDDGDNSEQIDPASFADESVLATAETDLHRDCMIWQYVKAARFSECAGYQAEDSTAEIATGVCRPEDIESFKHLFEGCLEQQANKTCADLEGAEPCSMTSDWNQYRTSANQVQ